MSTSSYKVYYFAINGKGAFIRALLSSQKIQFEDFKVEREDWPALKGTNKFEFGQLPALEVDGKVYTQTWAICHYIASKFDLLGTNEDEEYLINSLVASFEDFFPKYRPVVMPMNDTEISQAAELLKQFQEVHAPFFLKIYEERFKKHGGQYVVGDKFSLADVFITVFFKNLFLQGTKKETFGPLLTQYAPTLTKHVEKIAQNELAEYYSKYFIHDAPF